MPDSINAPEVPLYEKLASTLRGRIMSGAYHANTKLPSETQLMAKSGLSRGTVRRALNVLAEEGIVVKEHGKGVFVSHKPLVESDVFNFSSFTPRNGDHAGSMMIRIASAEEISSSEEVASFFGIDSGEPLVRIERVCYLRGEPLCLETTFLPRAFHDLVDQNLDRSIYAILRDTYRCVPARGRRTFEVCRARRNEAFLLDTEVEAPLMLVSDFVFDADGRPLLASRRVVRTDRATYTEPIE